MMLSSRFLSIACILSVLVTCAFVFVAFGADESSAASAVARAEADMVLAYEAVVEAERVGANVAVVLVRLNDAGESLAGAEVAYRLGDFDRSVGLADVCSVISGEVKSEAEELWAQAYEQGYFDMWSSVSVSLVSIVAVGLGGFWAWGVFKRRYYRGVLKMKPEVVSGES
jgi:hypothetical protein